MTVAADKIGLYGQDFVHVYGRGFRISVKSWLSVLHSRVQDRPFESDLTFRVYLGFSFVAGSYTDPHPNPSLIQNSIQKEPDIRNACCFSEGSLGSFDIGT